MPTGKEAGYVERYVTVILCGDFRQRDMCMKKNTYPTEAAAEAMIQGREAASGRDLRAYQCPYCGKWHLTSQPSWEPDDAPLAA